MTRPAISPWTQLQIGFVVFLIPALVVAAGIVLAGLAEGEEMSIPASMAWQGLGCLLAIAFVFALARRLGPSIGVRWRGRHGLGFHIVGAYALFLVLWFPFSFIAYPWALDRLGVEMHAQEHLRYFTEPSGQTVWIMIAAICFLGPIFEELVFRAFAQTGLRRLVGVWPAWIVTSALFGLMHGPTIALPLALMGGFFGYLRERDDGMLAPIAAHVLHNSVTVGLVLMQPQLLQQAFDR